MREPVRAYCRGCRGERSFRFVSWATDHGSENTVRPRAENRACQTCGLIVVALADVTDAEGLCRAALDRWLRSNGSGRATAVARPVGVGSLDAEELLAALSVELWRIYLRWNPLAMPRFLSFAWQWLPQRLKRIVADQTGAPFGKRVEPKSHAFGVALSFDAILSGWADGGEALAPSDARLARTLAERAVEASAVDGAGDSYEGISWLQP